MSQPMNEPEASHALIDYLRRFKTQQRFEFLKYHESLEIKDIHKRTVLNVRSCNSTCRARRELVDANDVMIGKFEKNLPTLHAGWTAYKSSGEKLFSLRNTDIFPKRTSITVSKVKDSLSLSLIRDLALKGTGLAVKDTGLGAEGPILGTKAGLLSAERADLAVKDASLGAIDMAQGAAGSLFAKRAGMAVEFVVPVSEKVAWEKEYQEKGSEYLSFEFKGSWTGKECAMYVAGSETKIAEMHPLEDNNTEGFFVDVNPNANWDFVILCFAVVEAMKSEAQKQKEFLGHVAGFTGKFLGGFMFGAGKCFFQCVCGGCGGC